MIKMTSVAVALLATATSPVAATQLEKSLGVPHGTYSISDLTRLKAARESDEKVIRLIRGTGAVFVRVK